MLDLNADDPVINILGIQSGDVISFAADGMKLSSVAVTVQCTCCERMISKAMARMKSRCL